MNLERGRRIVIAGGSLWDGSGFHHKDIVKLGNRIEDIVQPGEADDSGLLSVDATNCAVLPPFFNGHVHSSSTLLRGAENCYPLELWSFWAICYGRGASKASVRAAARLTAIEMIRAGVGGYIDHFPAVRFSEDALDAHRESGLRIGFAPFFADLRDEDLLDIPLERSVISEVANAALTEPELLRERVAQLAEEADTHITPLLGPNAPQRCSPELLEIWAQMAAKYALGSHTHLLETYPQYRAGEARWRGGPLFEMDRLELLNDRTSVAHAIWLDAPARNLLAERGATVIHNPVSNQMLGSGRMQVRAALDAGVLLGLGTDCTNATGRHDMFETMRQMLVSGREAGSWHGGWIKPQEVLTAGVRDGWAALGKRPATLTPGGLADLMVLDFRSVPLVGADTSAASIVNHGDHRVIRDLMVDGQWLMRDGKITVFDEKAVVDEAQQIATELREVTRLGRERLKSLINRYDMWSARVFSNLGCPHCEGLGIQASPIPTQGLESDH